MSYGLQVFDGSGNVTFDSTLAVAGACLGFYTVAPGGSTFAFPDFPAGSGAVLNANPSIPPLLYSIDNAPGYLRFVFDGLCAGGTYLLFAL